MTDNTEAVASAIRQLRRELGLSQVQLANAIGITPTSIYRYEAGTSGPDAQLLAALWNLAINHKSASATYFSELLGNLLPPLLPLLQAASVAQEALIDSVAILLPLDDRVLVMALIDMLKSKPGDSVLHRRMILLVLEPWLESARAKFANGIKESLEAPRMGADATPKRSLTNAKSKKKSPGKR
jgi:transcriptional regulator with XRE-family HTH domain